MHFGFALRLRRGDGVKPRRQRTQQASQLAGVQFGGCLAHHVDNRETLREALQLRLVARQRQQRLVARQSRILLDDLRRVDRQLKMFLQRLGQRQSFSAHLDLLIAFQPYQLQQLLHQFSIVFIPYAERIAWLVTQTGISQIDFNMAHVFI